MVMEGSREERTREEKSMLNIGEVKETITYHIWQMSGTSSSFSVKEREEGKGKGMLMEGSREERRRKENSMLNIGDVKGTITYHIWQIMSDTSSSFSVKEREEGKGKGMLMEGSREERRRKEKSMLNIGEVKK
jgi:hypothetical protein